MTREQAMNIAYNDAWGERRDWRKWNVAFASSLKANGWQLVPVEPTESMLVSTTPFEFIKGSTAYEHLLDTNRKIWRSLLAALEQNSSSAE